MVRSYRRFRCRTCGRHLIERSGGVLNRTCLPSDIIAFAVFCRLRYRLTLRDLSKIMALREIQIGYEPSKTGRRSCSPSWATSYASAGTARGADLGQLTLQ